MAEGKQKKVIQKLTVDAYLNAPGGKLRKAYAGEVKRLQKLGFKETDRKMGQREDHVRISFEREVERYPGVPLPSVPPYVF